MELSNELVVSIDGELLYKMYDGVRHRFILMPVHGVWENMSVPWNISTRNTAE